MLNLLSHLHHEEKTKRRLELAVEILLEELRINEDDLDEMANGYKPNGDCKVQLSESAAKKLVNCLYTPN